MSHYIVIFTSASGKVIGTYVQAEDLDYFIFSLSNACQGSLKSWSGSKCNHSETS